MLAGLGLSMRDGICWVAVQELKTCSYYGETLIFAIYPGIGNPVEGPLLQQPNLRHPKPLESQAGMQKNLRLEV